jgi:transaldolase
MRLVDLYGSRGIGPERLYIKLASTWEGVEACRKLQRQGVDCNMTLLFSFGQVRGVCKALSLSLIDEGIGRGGANTVCSCGCVWCFLCPQRLLA